MRIALIFAFLWTISSVSTFSQISHFPYFQHFEDNFLSYGDNVEFIEGWRGNQVRSGNSRIHAISNITETGKKGLAIQPISSFDGQIIINLDLSNEELMAISFFCGTRRNGTGTRPVLARISTSIDGGFTYIKRENLGDETSFPNENTPLSLYKYSLPFSAAFQPDVKIKIEVMYTTLFGTGTAAKFIMDDLSIFKEDAELHVTDVIVNDSGAIEVHYNQRVDPFHAEDIRNYSFEPNKTYPLNIIQDSNNKNVVTINLGKDLIYGDYQLKVKNIKALTSMRFLEEQIVPFSYKPVPVAPRFHDLLITEIMADPDPAVGLPLSEWIEIHNPTSKILILDGVVFSDNSSSTVLPAGNLHPGDYAILVPNSRKALFENFPNVIGLTRWPTLNISGDNLSLHSPAGDLLHAVEYQKSWHRNPFKNNGGWSLEMIDVNNPCGEASNWDSSNHHSGGTPGKTNSLKNNNPDISSPQLKKIAATDSQTVIVTFNEKIDLTSIQPKNFIIGNDIQVSAARLADNDLRRISLHLQNELHPKILYELKVVDVRDCAGNLINQAYSTLTFGLAEPADSLDIIVNEVLFNARSGGVKFVELYNRSSKFINLKNWYLGNSLDIEKSSLRLISEEALVLGPLEYIAINSNNLILKNEYPKGKQEHFHEINSLPSYPVSEGTVVVHDSAGAVIDHFTYSEALHSPLIKDKKGVSLERISPSPNLHKDNWKSAASTAGYATPGYKNSQTKAELLSESKLTIDPKVIIPGQTGFADFANINYKFEVPGQSGSVTIYDVYGQKIKKIVKNGLLGSEGFFTWDGTDERNLVVKTGYYLVLFEVYNLNGMKEVLKETVVVGKNF